MIGFGMIHSHFIGSEGPSLTDKGFIVTTEENQAIVLPMQVNTIQIFADTTDIIVKFNNDPTPMFIDAGSSDGIIGMPTKRFVVVGPAGQRVKWIGLTSIENT